MANPTKIRLSWLALALALAVGTANAATITIVNNDGAGEGFNDPTPRAPVGGNYGPTLGQQRLNIFNFAAALWGGILPSAVTIEVRAQFNPQTCTATSAVLGSTSSLSSHANFAGAPLTSHWYVASLANRLAGVDLNPGVPDMNITFNSNIEGSPTCLGGVSWYYGYDGFEGINIELLPVVMHEMGHGFGFATITNGSTGNFASGLPTIYDHYLWDNINGRTWDDPVETAAQRAASAISLTNLQWSGPSGINCAAGFLKKKMRMLINSPASIAGNYDVGQASFGPQEFNITGNVVLVDDGVAPTSDACEAIVNGAQLAGNIALLDRGTCTFVLKAQAAQAAGAIAVLIANNVAGIQPPGGTDPTIVIPVVGISQAAGNAIKGELLNGPVNATLNRHPTQLAGADPITGWPLMYAPNPFAGGSSVSHWDVSMSPNALLEPNLNADLHNNPDLTTCLFEDIGWFIGMETATELATFTAEGRPDGILVRWQFSDLTDVASITLERAPTEEGAWQAISTELGNEGAVTTALDRDAVAGTTYWYRLRYEDRQNVSHYTSVISGTRAGTYAGPVVLRAPSPNPASRGTSFSFRIGRPEYVRLSVTDASGRRIRMLHQGMLAPGEYTRTWDGLTDKSGSAPSGLYFITLGTSGGKKTQRVAMVR